MRFRIGRKPPPSAINKPAAADAMNTDGGAAALILSSPDHSAVENGSKDESFFEARPWLDSDSEDDFHSVRGDFTPSRGSTPDHQRQTSLTARYSADRLNSLKPSLEDKKQRLLELLQEKQQYDDEHDIVTDVDGEMDCSSVHAEEHFKPSTKSERAKKSSRAGCFPGSIWKLLSFRSCRKKRKERKDK